MHPDLPFLRFADGTTATYGAFCRSVQSLAVGLAFIGVKQGDTVNVWLPNTVDIVRAWFAINWLGAVYVPINTAYRGSLLSHVLVNGGARVLLANSGLVERLREIDCGTIETIFVDGEPVAEIEGSIAVISGQLSARAAELSHCTAKMIASADCPQTGYRKDFIPRSKKVPDVVSSSPVTLARGAMNIASHGICRGGTGVEPSSISEPKAAFQTTFIPRNRGASWAKQIVGQAKRRIPP